VAAPKRPPAEKVERSDRSVQTDARAKPARPDGGTASGALKAPLLDKAGKSAKSLTLEEAVFGIEPKPHLVHETVRAELNAARAGTRGGKSRGLVAGGRSKPWRQKGTGRARAGSIRAPHWTGGGLAFPPMMRSFESKVNRKARRAAMRSALSAHALGGTLGVLDPGVFDAPSTKAAAELVGAWGQDCLL
jgi:large subunit ribosomal protein L4